MKIQRALSIWIVASAMLTGFFWADVGYARPAHHARRPHRHAPSARLAIRDRSIARMDLTPRLVLDRPYGQLLTAPQIDMLPSSVSREMIPYGPVGSLGLVRFAGSNALSSGALGNSMDARSSLPSQRVGVNLSYDFR